MRYPMETNRVPLENWFVLCKIEDLKNGQVKSIKLMDKNIVYYRTSSGKLSAQFNRCPHMGIELSLGTIKKEQLVCRYHGWEFDTKGQLTSIPCKAQNEKLLKCSNKTFPVKEAGGWIWIWASNEEVSKPLPKYSTQNSHSYGSGQK